MEGEDRLEGHSGGSMLEWQSGEARLGGHSGGQMLMNGTYLFILIFIQLNVNVRPYFINCHLFSTDIEDKLFL